jgi:arylsulfatase A-like enzyme/Flp pilus assembly protein TadD
MSDREPPFRDRLSSGCVRTLCGVLAGLLLLAPSWLAAEAGNDPPDVLLITIDTLRADALGFAGNSAVETPLLDRLAADGRVFSHAQAHNVVTLPSHANILTGLYPYQHGVRDNSGFRLPAEVPTLATVLRGAGYATAAFVAAYPLDSQFGLDRGFETYDDRYPEGSKPTEFVLPERPAAEMVRLAAAWWDANRGAPRFLWLHLFDPHAPYAPPEPFAQRYRDRPYLGEVAATDAALAPLLESLLEDDAPPALVVVTADHGESLGEHGEATHGLFAYQATLAVPLVVWGAGVAPGRDDRLARHVDVFPTVLAAAGVEPPATRGGPRPGRSLLAAPADAVDSYLEALSATLNRGWGREKLIALPVPELYDLAQDPGESRDLFAQRRRTAAELAALLPDESRWPPARQVDASPAEEERLRALGYLSGSAGGRTSFTAADDPKRLIHLDRKMHRVIELYSRGEAAAAVELSREVVEERPEMALGQALLAQALLSAGRAGEALTVMREARRRGAVTTSLLRQLGLTLSESGATAEALAVLTPLAESGEPSSLNALALALSEAGRQPEARATIGRVLAIDPDNATARERLGLVELRLGRWAAARDESQRALALNPQLPLAWNNLGVALYQLQDAGGALDAWQRAVDLDSGLWDALYNLGTRALEHDRPEQARLALGRFVAGAPPGRYGAELRRARVLLGRLERASGP